MPSFLKSIKAFAFTALLLVGTRSGIVEAQTAPAQLGGQDPFEQLAQQYEGSIRPLLESHCLKCHNDDLAEGELDLARMESLTAVRRELRIWQKVLFMIENAEMPPKKSKQLTKEQYETLRSWVVTYLDAEAHANAGDPGRVVIRRLTNVEFDRTVRDLTGIDFRPTREFPEDSAAGEGFTNTGESMVMSPALIDKYLDVAQELASQAVLLPDGFRFSAGGNRPDWSEEPLDKIREIYNSDTQEYHFREKWGTVNLTPYCRTLIQQRERLRSDSAQVDVVAKEAGLNQYYLRHLTSLVSDETQSELLAEIQKRLAEAATLTDETAIDSEATAIANAIHTWRDQLWNIDPVGQLFNQGQQPQSPLTQSQEFRLELKPSGNEGARFSLVTRSGGDGPQADKVHWKNARIEGPEGSSPIALRDVRAHVARLNTFRRDTLASVEEYLNAIAASSQKEEFTPIPELAKAHGVNELLLRAWSDFLDISLTRGMGITGLITEKATRIAGRDSVSGWSANPPNVVANMSHDQTVTIPGITRPRTVHVHPDPQNDVAVGWRSLFTGHVRVEASVESVAGGGNGVTWKLTVQRGTRIEQLASGHIDALGSIRPPAINDLQVSAGDVVSLVIGAHDGNHSGDQTQVNLLITEQSNELRSWNLAADIAGDILAGNPHVDSFGHPDVWYFYLPNQDSKRTDVLPDGSLLARWRQAVESGKLEDAARLSAEVSVLFQSGPTKATPESDRKLYSETFSSQSAFFRRFDYATLAQIAPDLGDDTQDSPWGIDPAGFAGDGNGTLVVNAPNVTNIAIPTDIATGRTLVVTGEIAKSATGRVQLEVVAGKKDAVDSLAPGLPIFISDGSVARQQFEDALADFRELFPRIMCCRSVVPGHFVNTITLQKLHREDEHLMRLMMGDEERAHLDKLWAEVLYISRDAIETLEYYPLFVEFSTQGTDTHEFIPLEPGIRERASALEELLQETEPVHLNALIQFAARAFRRPITEFEERALLAMYADLRAAEETHDAAFRGVLSRVFISPAFLYRIEEPVSGEEDGAVNDWELATRMSYFLWSTMPDEKLIATAAAGRLGEPDTLVAEARRMLGNERVRGLATEFACQWLHVRGFDSFDEKNERQYPGFADIRDDMYEETIRFFEDLFRRDGSVLEILDADHTFLNETLAAHYGIEGITGDEWRRVDEMKQKSRGGVLGMATVLAKQSGATRTSPVLRGNWIVETLLGEKLPNPPATVPELPDALSREGLTVRQMTERHVSEESCSNCHVRIDPFGFALESFDAIGRYRTEDLIGQPVDTLAQLRDGTRFTGIDGLRSYLVNQRRNDFLEQLCRKLLGFALGRTVELSDQPLVDAMVKNLTENDFKFSAAVETILHSKQFRFHRGLESTHEESL